MWRQRRSWYPWTVLAAGGKVGVCTFDCERNVCFKDSRRDVRYAGFDNHTVQNLPEMSGALACMCRHRVWMIKVREKILTRRYGSEWITIKSRQVSLPVAEF